ncbi:MAG: DUF1223 domain-containing protein [Alphaproteobacteria bacterium]|nr:MAG: DUF1223 domain-containing protein [Alphaproteobacteria bacterium]
MKISIPMMRILCVLLAYFMFGASLGVNLAQAQPKTENKQGPDLVVVELFTSQGCNLCPPADKILAEFSQQDNILALSYSVDYWNYLGWKDTLAMAACTSRQKNYNISLGKNGVYTPQMIIQGSHDVIGSRRDLARDKVDQARGASRLKGQQISFTLSGDMIELSLSAQERKKSATIWVIGYDFEKTVAIKRGELAGQVGTYRNVVQAIKRVVRWRGEAIKLTLSLKDIGEGSYDGYALLVQEGDTGPILAARKIERPEF